jgi:hypothetical protein
MDAAGMARLGHDDAERLVRKRARRAGLGFLLNNEMDDFATRPARRTCTAGAGRRERGRARQAHALLDVPVDRRVGGETCSSGDARRLDDPDDQPPGARPTPAARRAARRRASRRRASTSRTSRRDPVENGRFDADWLDALAQMGHEIKDRKRLGCVHAIAVEKDGPVVAAADPRGSGAALIEREAR